MAEGFNPFDGELTLRFAGTRYEGAEITLLLDVPMGDMLSYFGLQKVTEQMEWMADHGVLVRWNLTDRGGVPLPATGENLKNLPLQLARAIGREYERAAAAPDIPFEQPSPAGERSAAPSDETGGQSSRRRNTRRS